MRALTLVVLLCGCGSSRPAPDQHLAGRLIARPRPSGGSPPPAGALPLGMGAPRDGLLYVPEAVRGPAPLLVVLHPAGGDAKTTLLDWREAADATGLILMLPESRGPTWDLEGDHFSADPAAIDAALARTFERVPVDKSRVFVAGFADGASYALVLGLGNGDLFTRVVACSPVTLTKPPRLVGKPRIFVAHGRQDPVLPIETHGRLFTIQLRAADYAVEYREFDGLHELPSKIVRAAVTWLVAPAMRSEKATSF